MVNIQFKLGTLRKRKRLQTPSGPYPGAPAQPLRLRRRLPGDGAGGPPARTRIAPAWAAMSAMFHAGPGRLAPNQHLAARPRRTPGQPGPAQPARPGPAGCHSRADATSRSWQRLGGGLRYCGRDLPRNPRFGGRLSRSAPAALFQLRATPLPQPAPALLISFPHARP